MTTKRNGALARRRSVRLGYANAAPDAARRSKRGPRWLAFTIAAALVAPLLALVAPSLLPLTSGGVAAAATPPGPNSVAAEGTAVWEPGNGATLPGPVVAIAEVPGGQGYWTVSAAGAVGAVGSAPLFGQITTALNAPIVGIAAVPGGGGYWLLGSDGGVFSFGDAQFYGSTGGLVLNKPVVGMAAAPGGNGYWLVAADGGVFSFPNSTPFYGSAGNLVLNKPVVGMAAAPDGGGYWLVASDGGIFSYGTAAQFHGSTGNLVLNAPVVGMAAAPTGGGYWLVGSDGGVFSFGSASFNGASVGGPIDSPVVGIAAGASGYWIAHGSTAPLNTPLGQEETLAQLGYLPLAWTSLHGFAWLWPAPAQLAALWVPGQNNLILTGAIDAFEAVVGLPMNGTATGNVIAELQAAVANPGPYLNPNGYTYALAQEHVGLPTPETLTVWHNGVVVQQTPTNTGIASTPTEIGTFPVYIRYRNQIMTGLNPNGTPYADPVQYVAYFNSGDAIHYMPRTTYGYPQSLGCVEIPLAAAAVIWNYTTYGTLVTVTLN